MFIEMFWLGIVINSLDVHFLLNLCVFFSWQVIDSQVPRVKKSPLLIDTIFIVVFLRWRNNYYMSSSVVSMCHILLPRWYHWTLGGVTGYWMVSLDIWWCQWILGGVNGYWVVSLDIGWFHRTFGGVNGYWWFHRTLGGIFKNGVQMYPT